jgi:hypothetical protein
MNLIHLEVVHDKQTYHFPLAVFSPGDLRFIHEICRGKSVPAVYAHGGRGDPDIDAASAALFWRRLEPRLLQMWQDGELDGVQPGGRLMLAVFDSPAEGVA